MKQQESRRILAVMDVAGSVIEINDDAPGLGGLSAGEVIYDFVHPEDRLVLADAHRRVVFGDSDLVALTLRVGGGSLWLLATGSASRRGDSMVLDLSTEQLAPWRDEPMLSFTLKYEPDVSPNSWVQIRQENGIVHVRYGGPMTIRRMRRLLVAAGERALPVEVRLRFEDQFRAACTRDRYDEIAVRGPEAGPS